MKKYISKSAKILSTLIITAIIFITGITTSAAPSTITVKKSEILSNLIDIDNGFDYGFTIFTTSDGNYIYCMDISKKPLSSGDTATLGNDGDAGLLYILQNGYPNKKITGNTEADKYITQAAVWWYIDEASIPAKFKNATKENDPSEILPDIKNLVNKARSAKDNQAKPSMKITNNGTVLTKTKDGKYYESPLMSAALVGATTYKVSLSGGTKNTITVDANGNAKSSFSSSERFKVRVPASEINSKMEITLSFNATGSIKKAKIYNPSKTGYQRMIGLYDDAVELKDTLKLSVNPSKRICEYDKEKNKYYGIEGKEVDKKTWEQECNPKCEYKDGKYYGKKGNEVNEETFKKECGEEVPVPNTSANISAIAIAFGILVIAFGGAIIAYRKKHNQIS